MDAFDPHRRSFLMGAGSLGLSQVLPPSSTQPHASQQAYVLGSAEGETLMHFRDHGAIIIKASPATGSQQLSLGTQQVMRGTGIPVHRHFHMDEAFHVLEGSGSFVLNDVPHPFEKGATIFIPRNAWHSFQNPDHELLLLWIVSPPGLEDFFRETCTAPGAPSKQFTREQIHEIALKYGTEFR